MFCIVAHGRRIESHPHCCAAPETALAFRLVEKKAAQIFSLSCRSPIEAIASGWRARAFVLILTLSGFRKIVGTQRQKIDAHSLGENA
jgi:hypothetical protein